MCESNYSEIWMHLNPSGEYVGNTDAKKKKKKEKKSELICCKMRDMALSSHSPASSLLHTLVAIQNAFEQLCH